MKVIGISGYARCGKDTFVSIAKDILTKNGYNPRRVAFADKLKEEVQSALNHNSFSLDVYTTDTSAKKEIRPLLVWWGCTRRQLSDEGLYWVKVVDLQLREIRSYFEALNQDLSKVVILVSDVRFLNEADWVHKSWQGQVIHLKRFSTHYSSTPVYDPVTKTSGNSAPIKTFDSAPNEEEAKNDPLVQEVSDVHVEWQSRDIPPGKIATDDSYLKEEVLKALNSTKFFRLS